ncbi:hypothetical protein TNCV_1861881 [Trichonephila clavipes]|nr:hypothetical protein TNCV_1861881 [Trichonephila clavipes]
MAFWISRKTAPVDFRSLIPVLMYSTTRRSWCDVESSAWKPCCWGMRMSLVLRYKQSLFRIISSDNLLRIGSNEMGLKLSGKVGSLPGFKIGIIEAVFQACGK